MEEKYVWKVTFYTTEKDIDGNAVLETRNVIASDIDSVYVWAKENVEFDEGNPDGFTGINEIRCASDLMEVI